MIPEPYEFGLLVLIAGRLWKLLADDEVLDRPRNWVLDRLDAEDTRWELFLTCPWCAGFWLSGVTYVTWLWALGDPQLVARAVVVGVGVWFAINALVGLYGLTVKTLQHAAD